MFGYIEDITEWIERPAHGRSRDEAFATEFDNVWKGEMVLPTMASVDMAQNDAKLAEMLEDWMSRVRRSIVKAEGLLLPQE